MRNRRFIFLSAKKDRSTELLVECVSECMCVLLSRLLTIIFNLISKKYFELNTKANTLMANRHKIPKNALSANIFVQHSKSSIGTQDQFSYTFCQRSIYISDFIIVESMDFKIIFNFKEKKLKSIETLLLNSC